ncbi:MAG: peptidylprolyl isomerase, partial [Rudaea sp.]
MLKHALLSLALFLIAPLALAQQPAKASTKPAATASKPATVAPTAVAANPKVIVHTSQGDIEIELYAEKAPKSVDNFLQYVKDGFYSGTVFH